MSSIYVNEWMETEGNIGSKCEAKIAGKFYWIKKIVSGSWIIVLAMYLYKNSLNIWHNAKLIILVDCLFPLKTWIDIFKGLPDTNPAEFIIGILALVALIIVKIISVRWKDKLKVPIPIELIIVSVWSYTSNSQCMNECVAGDWIITQ